MKFSTILLLLVGLVAPAFGSPLALALAKDKDKDKDKDKVKIKVKKLPQCSVECIENAMAHYGCSVSDFRCGCLDFATLKKHAKKCVLKSCGIHTARKKVLPAVKSICEAEEIKAAQAANETGVHVFWPMSTEWDD